VSTSVALALDSSRDSLEWVSFFATLLAVEFDEEGDLWVSPHLGSELLFHGWSFGDEEDDYDDPELQGMEWSAFLLKLWKLHTKWHDLEVCVRRTFMLVLQEELESCYGIRSQPFYNVQSRIRRGYGGVLPRRKYRGRDQERFVFGEEIRIEAKGIEEIDLIERVRDFLPVDLVPITQRLGTYLGMPVAVREVSPRHFVIAFAKIPGVHIDDDLTFRMGLALLLADHLNRANGATFVAKTAGGHGFSPHDVPLCTEETVLPSTSLVKG